MAFSTKSARRSPLSAELRDWCDGGADTGTRTVIMTLQPNADVVALSEQLVELGGDIVSAGAGATIATLPRPALLAACTFPGIVRIEAPGRLSPKPGGSAD